MPTSDTQFPVPKIEDTVCDAGYNADPADCFRFRDYYNWTIKWYRVLGWLAAALLAIGAWWAIDFFAFGGSSSWVIPTFIVLSAVIGGGVWLYQRNNEAEVFCYRNRYFLANRDGVITGSSIEFDSMPWSSIAEIHEDSDYVYFATNRHPLPIPAPGKSGAPMGFSVPKRVFVSPVDAVRRLRDLHRTNGQNSVNPLQREKLGEPIASVSFQPEGSEIKRLFDFIQNGYKVKSNKAVVRIAWLLAYAALITYIVLSDAFSSGRAGLVHAILHSLDRFSSSLLQISITMLSIYSTRIYANRAARNPNRSVGVTATITPNGLYVEGPGIISASAWGNVKTAYDDKGVLLICFYNKTGYAIPSRIFTSETQYKQFARQLNALQRGRIDLLDLMPDETEVSWPPAPKTLA